MSTLPCSSCSATIPPDMKFCQQCGAAARPAMVTVTSRGPAKPVPALPSVVASHGPARPVPSLPLRSKSVASSTADPVQEMAVRRWVEAVLQVQLVDSDICTALKSGVELCSLLNHMQPNMIKRINRSNQLFLMLENVGRFCLGALALGVLKQDVIQATDLFDSPNPVRVVACLLSLNELARTNPTFNGPYVELQSATTRLIVNTTAPALPVPVVSPIQTAAMEDLVTNQERNHLQYQSPASSGTSTSRRLSTKAISVEKIQRRMSARTSIEVQSLIEEKRQLECDTANRIAEIERTHRAAVDQLEQERRGALLESERLRSTVHQQELDREIEQQKEIAERLSIVQQHQENAKRTKMELKTRLRQQYESEIEQLKSIAARDLEEKRKEMLEINSELEAQRRIQHMDLNERIAQLQDALAAKESHSNSEQCQMQVELEKVRHESRVQVAIELERVRLEADQRAIEQVREQAEIAKREITSQVTAQCHVEMERLKRQFEDQLRAEQDALKMHTDTRARTLRASFDASVIQARLAATNGVQSIQSALEAEKSLRAELESSLHQLKLELEANTIREEERRTLALNEQEDALQYQFDSELARLTSVLEQRVKSEEAQRVAQQVDLELKLANERSQLDSTRRRLAELETEVEQANRAEKQSLEVALNNMREAVKKTESEAKVRVAVEAERDRVMKQIIEMETSKRDSDISYEAKLGKASQALESQTAALVQLQRQMAEKTSQELTRLTDTRDHDGRRKSELERLKKENEQSVREYQAEISRLKTEVQQNSSKVDIVSELQRQLDAQISRADKAESQLSAEKRLTKFCKAEIASLKGNTAALSPAQPSPNASSDAQARIFELEGALQSERQITANAKKEIDLLKEKLNETILKSKRTAGEAAAISNEGANLSNVIVDLNIVIKRLETQLTSERQALEQSRSDFTRLQQQQSAALSAVPCAPPPPFMGVLPPAPPPPMSSGGLPLPPPPPAPKMNGVPPSPPTSAGGQADLMAAIRNKQSLKKVDRSAPKEPTIAAAPVDANAALLAAIQARPKLKKATERVLKSKTSVDPNVSTGVKANSAAGGMMGMMGMMNIAQIAAQKAEARRKRVAESNK